MQLHRILERMKHSWTKFCKLEVFVSCELAVSSERHLELYKPLANAVVRLKVYPGQNEDILLMSLIRSCYVNPNVCHCKLKSNVNILSGLPYLFFF